MLQCGVEDQGLPERRGGQGLWFTDQDTVLKRSLVPSLSSNVDELAMYRLFAQFGAIASIRVEMDFSRGLSKGYGFVPSPLSIFNAVHHQFLMVNETI